MIHDDQQRPRAVEREDEGGVVLRSMRDIERRSQPDLRRVRTAQRSVRVVVATCVGADHRPLECGHAGHVDCGLVPMEGPGPGPFEQRDDARRETEALQFRHEMVRGCVGYKSEVKPLNASVKSDCSELVTAGTAIPAKRSSPHTANTPARRVGEPRSNKSDAVKSSTIAAATAR